MYTKLEVNHITQNAIDALCAYVQNELGITSGDVAGDFWSDERLVAIISDYVTVEIQNKGN